MGVKIEFIADNGQNTQQISNYSSVNQQVSNLTANYNWAYKVSSSDANYNDR